MTKNEVKALTYLFRHYDEKLSINELARRIKITPKGVYKILKKFENDGLVIKEKVANAHIYRLNFEDQKTGDIVKYALKSEDYPNKYVKVLYGDLEKLKVCTSITILFGSVLTKGTGAKDIDLLAVINKNNLPELNKEIREFEMISPKKIHFVVQTKSDLRKNLHDSVIQEAIQKGFILSGHDLLYGVIGDAS